MVELLNLIIWPLLNCFHIIGKVAMGNLLFHIPVSSKKKVVVCLFLNCSAAML